MVNKLYKLRVYLTYPEELIKKPVIYELGHKFNIVTNIRGASVKDGIGLIALEIDGEKKEVEKCLKYLSGIGIEVKPVEQDVVE